MKERRELAEAMIEAIGLEATRTLVRLYGGKRIKVPSGKGKPGSFSAWLDDNLGLEAARRFRATFGGEDIAVPKLYAQLIAVRNRLIVEDYSAGLAMLDLVMKHQLTERQIRSIINRPLADIDFALPVVDDRQMGLF